MLGKVYLDPICQGSNGTRGFGAVAHKVDGHSCRRRAVQLDMPLVSMHTCRIAGTHSLRYGFWFQARAAILHAPSSRCQRLTARRLANTPGTKNSNRYFTQSTSQVSSTSCGNADAILTKLQMLQARQYVRLVLEQNTTMNLTGMSAVANLVQGTQRGVQRLSVGATSEEEAFQMHIEDSLALLPVLDAITKQQTASRQEDAKLACSILDVGSGGGLPGVILAIARPDWQVPL